MLDLLHRVAVWMERYAMLFALAGLLCLGGLGGYMLHVGHVNSVLGHRVQRDERTLAHAQVLLRGQQEQQKTSRREATLLSCREANEKHAALQRGLHLLIAKTPVAQRPHTPADRRRRAEGVVIFTNAVAPRYDCATRVRELTRAHPQHSGRVKLRLTHRRRSGGKRPSREARR